MDRAPADTAHRISTVFTTPIQLPPEPASLAREELRTEEELRLMQQAGAAPLKIRWRRSWNPEKVAALAQLYLPEHLRTKRGTELDLDRLAVNFLRHNKTAYEDIVHRHYGVVRGQLGEYPEVYLIVKTRVHQAIAADFTWLAEESDRQLSQARQRVQSAKLARTGSAGRILRTAA